MMIGETLTTVMIALAELFAELLSIEEVVATTAVLVIWPAIAAVAEIVKEAVPEAARDPKLQVKTPFWFVHAPAGKFATPEESPDGSVSVTIIFTALSRQRLET